MLHAFIGSTNIQMPFASFSMADRGNVWPDDLQATPSMPGMNDFDTVAEGLIAGTTVATEMGWIPVEDLRVGDRVVTFDNGMQRLAAVSVSTLYTAEKQAPRAVWPVQIPEKVLGNRTALTVLPEQALLIESDESEALFGDPFVLVSAASLDGYKGITRVPPTRSVQIVTLHFESEEVIYANGTALVHCPNNNPTRVTTAEELMNAGQGMYFRLPRAQSDMLVQAMRQG